MERRDHETALRHFVEASRANSGHPDAHMGMAEAMRAMGRLAAARATLEQYLRENARYAPAWLLLGQIRAQEGRREEAREAFERVIEVAPTGASARRARQELERL